MAIEEQLLAASVRNTIRDADRALTRYFHVSEGNTADNVDEGEHAEELDEARVHLQFLIEKVFRDTSILAERLGLPKYRKDVMRKMRSFKDLAETEVTPWDVMFHSPPLAAARSLYGSLAVMTEGREVTGLGVFETILANTPKIIDRAGLSPSSEAQVREAVREVLQFSFRDVVREIPLAKNLKVYKPDIGVRSLMAAAEYKFIDSETEAKTALDGIYADMRGYSGHPEWRSFYAVFYMTSPFYTQKDVDAEFELVKADLSWKPVVLVGPGKRKGK
jgi:hypothetical protein